MYLLFSRNAASGIAYRNNGNIVVYGQNYVNAPTVVVELDRIIEKIEQQPPDLAGIKGAYYVLLHSTGNFDSTLAGLSAHAVNRRLHQLREVFLFPLKLDLLVFRLGQFHQV